MYDELLTLADEARASAKLVNNRSTGSDVDRQKLQEKGAFFFEPPASFGHGMVYGRGSKFRITESVFRFWRGCRAGDDLARRSVVSSATGSVPIENHLQLNDETEESQPDGGGKNND